MSRLRIRAVTRQMFAFAGLALCAAGANAAETGSSDADSTVTAPSQAPEPKSDSTVIAPKDAEPSNAQRQSVSEAVQLPEVTVVGSRLPTAELQTAQDVHIYYHPRIEQSGQSTVSDFLGTLPEVSLLSPENTTNATQVRLRGAIFGSALVLINGRRTEPTTGGAATAGFFDINTIPLSLVERIEVLPTWLVGHLRRRRARRGGEHRPSIGIHGG
jgi:outer membrane cobalamin receptor